MSQERAGPFDPEAAERESLRREVMADPPGMIKEGWSYWFTHTGWKLLLLLAVAAAVVAGLVAALV